MKKSYQYVCATRARRHSAALERMSATNKALGSNDLHSSTWESPKSGRDRPNSPSKRTESAQLSKPASLLQRGIQRPGRTIAGIAAAIGPVLEAETAGPATAGAEKGDQPGQLFKPAHAHGDASQTPRPVPRLQAADVRLDEARGALSSQDTSRGVLRGPTARRGVVE